MALLPEYPYHQQLLPKADPSLKLVLLPVRTVTVTQSHIAGAVGFNISSHHRTVISGTLSLTLTSRLRPVGRAGAGGGGGGGGGVYIC